MSSRERLAGLVVAVASRLSGCSGTLARGPGFRSPQRPTPVLPSARSSTPSPSPCDHSTCPGELRSW